MNLYVGAEPGLEWLHRIRVDDILWQGVPDDNASRVEWILVALDMAEWLDETLVAVPAGWSGPDDRSIRLDTTRHTEHLDCSSPEPSLLKAFQLEVMELLRCFPVDSLQWWTVRLCAEQPLLHWCGSCWYDPKQLRHTVLQLWTNQAFVTGGSDLAGAGWQIPPKESNGTPKYLALFVNWSVCPWMV